MYSRITNRSNFLADRDYSKVRRGELFCNPFGSYVICATKYNYSMISTVSYFFV